MSNLGLEIALRAAGIDFRRAQVGDRYVLAMLRETGGTLGGETSGHILCLDKTTTGDGLVSALQVLAVMKQTGQSLAELAAGHAEIPAGAAQRESGAALRSGARCPRCRKPSRASKSGSEEKAAWCCGPRAPSPSSGSWSKGATSA